LKAALTRKQTREGEGGGKEGLSGNVVQAGSKQSEATDLQFAVKGTVSCRSIHHVLGPSSPIPPGISTMLSKETNKSFGACQPVGASVTAEQRES